MKCPYCNNELEEGAAFCGICGHSTASILQKPKQSNSMKILVIVLAVALAAALCGFGAYLIFANGLSRIGEGNQPSEIVMDSSREETPFESNSETTVPTEAVTEEVTTAPAENATEEEKVTGYDDGIHRYDFIVDDVTWLEAYDACIARGGHLVTFETDYEVRIVCDQIADDDKRDIVFFIGGRRDMDSQIYYWVGENNQLTDKSLSEGGWESSWWLEGEPSYQDQDVEEYCMDMFYRSSENRWVWNDAPNDVLAQVDYYKGKIGYICEYED